MRRYSVLRENIVSVSNLDKNGVYKIYHKQKPGVFYIGSTFRNNKKVCKKGMYGRWIEHWSLMKKGEHHSIYLQNVINKYGLEGIVFEVIEICDTELESRTKENYYINTLDSIKNGYNSNDNTFHPTLTQEERDKASVRMSVNNPMKNKKTVLKVKKSKEKNTTKVLQHTLDGHFIKKHDSTFNASIELNVDASNINRALNDRTKKSAGCIWIYDDDFTEKLLQTKLERLKQKYKPSEETIKQMVSKTNKKVIQYTLNSKIVKEWDSLKEASDALSIPSGNISHCCRKIYKTCKGFIWKYKTL